MIANKAELLSEIEQHAASSGATLLWLGGDCMALVVTSEIRVVLALKESTMKDTLWVGAPIQS